VGRRASILRNDAGEALSALSSRREESLAVLRKLTPAKRERGSTNVTLGRMTFEDWTALVAAHDDKHLAQLERALRGRA
jgi:DinB family protein